jgi:hypothetical protein
MSASSSRESGKAACLRMLLMFEANLTTARRPPATQNAHFHQASGGRPKMRAGVRNKVARTIAANSAPRSYVRARGLALSPVELVDLKPDELGEPSSRADQIRVAIRELLVQLYIAGDRTTQACCTRQADESGGCLSE